MNLPTSREINNPQGLTCMKDEIIARQKTMDTELEDGLLTALHDCQQIFGTQFPHLPVKDQQFLIHICFHFGKDRLSKIKGMFDV